MKNIYPNKKNPLIVMIITLTIAMTAVQGCGIPAIWSSNVADSGQPSVEIVEENVPLTEGVSMSAEPVQALQRADFKLRYDSESSLNPITGLNSANILLSSLLYEPLFTLGSGFTAVPVICESWSIDEDDEMKHTYVIKPDIAMHDGSSLTADDVAYTLNQARQKGRYINRFDNVSSIASDGELTVTIVLKSYNSRFNRLLDIPIIKEGSMDSNVPSGTGPYVLSGVGNKRLERFVQYREFSNLSIPVIFLLECNDSEVMELFDDGEISLLWDDPSGTAALRLNSLFESRYFDTTTLQFIGFNARKAAIRDADVRRAIGCAVNRELITTTIIPGQSLAAPLAISPAYANYSSDWENSSVDPLVEMSALLSRAGMIDSDGDPFLEYPDYSGNYNPLTIDFIVNAENTYKVAASNKIAETLRLSGIDIAVRELPWVQFVAALETGDFDMYYGEAALGADFDFSSLILPKGSLNYGNTGSIDYIPYLGDFLSARTTIGEAEAARLLCNEILYNAPFIPILYKKYAVYTPIGLLVSASPNQSGVFTNVADWDVKLTKVP